MKKDDPKIDTKFKDFLDKLRENKLNDDAESLLRQLIKDIIRPNFEDIWVEANAEEASLSYWIFIANDIHDKKEAEFVKQLMFWSEFYIGKMAKVKFLQTFENLYPLCVKKFKLDRVPSLLVSDNPYFDDFIVIDEHLFLNLSIEKTIGFFNNIHRELSSGKPLDEVNGVILKSITDNRKSGIEELKKYIEAGMLYELFDEIELYLPNIDRYKSSCLILKREFKDLENNKLKGVVTNEYYQIERNKINSRLLQFIESVEKRY